MEAPSYSVRALKSGESYVPGPLVFYVSDVDRWYHLYFYVWVVWDRERTVLIDAGVPADAAALDAQIRARRGSRAYWRSEPGFDLPATLAGMGLAATVTDVCLSTLAPYTVGWLDAFPEATVHLSRRGWLQYTARDYPQLHQPLPASVERRLLSGPRGKLRLIDGRAALAPGITAVETGGHHSHSLAVEIATPRGTAIMADSVFYYRNLEEDVPIGILENIFDCYDCHHYLRARADLVLPSHDPAVLERYPDGWVCREVG